MADVFEELEEEDVWAVMGADVKKERSPKAGRASCWDPTSSAKEPPRRPGASRTTFPASHADVNSSGGDGWHGRGKAFRKSAPVNIPDWSKIYGQNKGRGYMGAPASTGCSLGDGGFDDRDIASSTDAGDDEEDEGDGGILPPHEWIANKLARSQISSSSVCEGAGRTLKGRDLSRVRNAVLTRTGFLE